MQLSSINIGLPQPLEVNQKVQQTGIFKRPVAGAVQVTVDGLPGDAILSTRHHGGPDQAVYIYGGADYAWWAAQLGRDLQPGTFGENLTISELESAAFSIGDLLAVGGVILQVTAPRIPCAAFAARMGDPAFIQRFRAAERPGLYCRVLRPGTLQAGDAVRVLPYTAEKVTIVEMFRDFYDPNLGVEAIRRHLAAPIAIRDRLDKEAQLKKLQEG